MIFDIGPFRLYGGGEKNGTLDIGLKCMEGVEAWFMGFWAFPSIGKLWWEKND